MNENEIREVIGEAVNAPSGHNFQPWRFEVGPSLVRVFLVPDADTTILNYRQRGSYLAAGACIENMSIVLGHRGYVAAIDFFPKGKGDFFVAEINISAGVPPETARLYPAIARRSTNRKPYDRSPLGRETVATLLSEANGNGVSAYMVEARDTMKAIAAELSVSDWLLFNNRSMHAFVFDHIRWTAADESRTHDGLYLPTLELDPPARMFFPLFKRWNFVRFLGSLGFGTVVAKQNAGRYASAGAFGLFTAPSFDPFALIETGRAIERLWLAATVKGLNIQPIMGILYLGHIIEEQGTIRDFTPEQLKKIAAASATIRAQFPADEGVPAFLFRIGRGGEPSARSSKKPPRISPVRNA